MGQRLSAHQNRKRVSSRFSPTKNINKSETGQQITNSSAEIGTNSTTDTTTNAALNNIVSSLCPPSNSSQSSDGIIRQGRKFHNEQTSTYWFPNDDEEMDRLVGQHFALKTLFDGNIPDKVIADPAISLKDGAKILDCGCGPGTWIMDVATEYPSSEFIGVDMCDVFPNNIRPANATFQVGNVLEGLSFPDSTFDLVNFRFFILAFKTEEWAGVLKEIKRVLKPGGYILSREAGMLEIGSDFVKWAGKIFKERMIERGQEPYIAEKMKSLMEQENFQVTHCVKKDTFPGRSDHLNREFLWDLKNIFRSGQPFLAEHLKVTPEEYPAFLEEFVVEMQKLPETQWSITQTTGRKPLN